MFKKRSKSHILVLVEHNWIILLKIMTLCMFIAAMYAFVSVNTFIPAPAQAGQSQETFIIPENIIPEPEKTEDAKPAIIKWMKERSIAPEHVLIKIYEEALRHTHPHLILAICAVESNFNPGVVSEKGAVGLMGILPSVWMEELKTQGILRDREDLYLVSNNIASGIYVLEKYLLKSRNIEDALYAYVGGDRSYADKVLRTVGEIHLSEMPHVAGIRVKDRT